MQIKTFFKKIHTFVLDALFPACCLGCKKEGAWICEVCFSRIKFNTQQVCPVCEKRNTPDGRICFECMNKKPLDGLLNVSSYQDKLLHKAVHHYKYRFIHDLHVPLGNLLLKAFENSELPLPEIIIPVPLHARRLRWRGFNQATLLAKELGNKLTPNFAIPVLENVLIRQKYTAPQMKIKHHAERQANLANAFAIENPQAIKNKRILLVDDIATTGSTIFECAKVLKQNGARSVFAIVLARQSSSNS